MPPQKSEDYKISAVQYYLSKNNNQVQTCEVFQCHPRSLMRWVDKYNKNKNITRKNRLPKSYKVKKEQVDYILKTLRNDKTITMNDMLQKVKEKYPDFDITSRHIGNIVRDNNITLKLTRFRHEPTKRFGKDININKNIKLFYEKVKQYKIDDIICIDETSIKSLQKRKFCYSRKGKRCVVKTHLQEVFKKYTGIFAISTKGVLGWKLYDKGGINSERLYDFLQEHITNKYKNKLIIIDNASSHRNQKIKDLINKDNEILYSVPYQHFTNAIENWFSVLKSKLQKKEGLTYNHLQSNIEKVLLDIPLITFKNIFKGVYERPEKYKLKNKTRKIKKNYL